MLHDFLYIKIVFAKQSDGGRNTDSCFPSEGVATRKKLERCFWIFAQMESWRHQCLHVRDYLPARVSLVFFLHHLSFNKNHLKNTSSTMSHEKQKRILTFHLLTFKYCHLPISLSSQPSKECHPCICFSDPRLPFYSHPLISFPPKVPKECPFILFLVASSN